MTRNIEVALAHARCCRRWSRSISKPNAARYEQTDFTTQYDNA